MKNTLLSSVLAVTMFVGACGPQSDTSPTSSGSSSCTSRAYDTIGGPISLTDHTGQMVTEADYKGRETFVYFGFTNCPDVCPFTLSTIGSAMDLLPENAEKPRTILISVDPEQDTPEALAQYIESNGFPEDLIGLTGSNENLREAAKAFKTDFKKVETPDSALGYTMDHLSILYLMDKNWNLKTFFTSEATPSDIAGCIVELSDK